MLLFPSLPVAASICWPVLSLIKQPSTPTMDNKNYLPYSANNLAATINRIINCKRENNILPMKGLHPLRKPSFDAFRQMNNP